MNLGKIDSTSRPAPVVPVAAVAAYRISSPWGEGNQESRRWWRGVNAVLDAKYCGDTMAAYLEGALPSVCLDLCANNSWQVLYPASTKADEISEVLKTITDEAGVEPVMVERVDVTPGLWGDDVTQVLVVGEEKAKAGPGA